MIQTTSKYQIQKIKREELEKLSNFVNQIYSEKELKFKKSEHFPTEFLEGVYCIKEFEENTEKIKGYFALYQNPNLIYKNKKTLCIGNYECINDLENEYIISSQIIDFCKQKAKKLKAEFLIAPMNGSTWNEYRFLNFDKTTTLEENLQNTFLLEPIHQNYYSKQFLNASFEPISTYFSLLDTKMDYGNKEVLRQQKRLENENITIRKINLKSFEQELENLFPFVSNLFEQNFLYTPISLESFKEKYLPIKQLINPDYVLIAEHKINNITKIVGFIFCYPNLYSSIYSQSEKQLVCKTIGRNQDDFYKGLGHVMTYKVAEQAKKDGFSAFIHAFMIENSLSSELSQNFAKQKYRTYTLYGMNVE
ncbi:hypothetical protein ACE193_05970 [Bernardetia sp. OM2101]|uniref:hypothetical protein n=1 Tax=Bernardetia sp. OM2101 TaxID=3344876 RepID=UPI0035CFA94D